MIPMSVEFSSKARGAQLPVTKLQGRAKQVAGTPGVGVEGSVRWCCRGLLTKSGLLLASLGNC